MAKGSQFSQLKSALAQAGFNKQQKNGKKRTSSSRPVEHDKIKKAAKLREIQQKLNPFDVKVTKLKHDVGGRKVKGAVGRPAQSKQAGMQQREKTLLKEFEERGRVGGVVDRRFGENDPSMSLEERMLERFTRERQRMSKAAAFNLEDEEELTHYGQSLSKLDDFDDVGLPMDEDDEEESQLDRETVKHAHFGGFNDEEGPEEDEEPGRKKSKAEVMAEVIAKSKEHKMLRQMEKEKEENIRHQLDQDFDSLRTLLYAPDPTLNESAAIPLGGTVGSLGNKQEDGKDALDYDKQVRELAFDKRAKPKDRTKTEEELALEQKEALEQAERQRRRRMLGEEADESDDEGESGRKRKRVRGGDDLDDDFVEDEPMGGLGQGLRPEGSVSASLDSESGAEEEDFGVSGSDGDESEEKDGDMDASDDEDDAMDDGASEGEEGEFDEITTKRRTITASKTPASSQELPYTFPAPESHDEFLEVVDNVKEDDVPIVVQRMRTLYHPSLAPQNKVKLQYLTRVLIDHVLYVASPPAPRMKLLSSLIPHLFSLSKSYPIESSEYFVEKLSLMHKNLKRGLAAGALVEGTRTWPGSAELILLRIIGVVWPTSDMRHPVVSPARLLMGSYLGLCRIRSFADVASGLFLCSLFLQYEALSKRLVPEAVNFAVNTTLLFAPHPFTTKDLPGSFPSPDFRPDLCTLLAINVKSAKKLVFRKPEFSKFLAMDPTEQAKIDAFGLVLDILDRFADMYKALDGFIELYDPIHLILTRLECQGLSAGVQSRVSSVQDKLGRLLKFARRARRPLVLQAHKPIPIPTYIPKFDSGSSSYLRRQDPDHERNEASKLRYQLKQERKGAIRELRKDARFLAAAEHKKQMEKDAAYKSRMSKAFSSLEEERAEQKAMDREKAKEKRRAGRK
ncbi:Nop14-like protein [Phlebopus sp. FC_14]|nr:Nop14-like protein [Phlebopus sp. FC_14]